MKQVKNLEGETNYRLLKAKVAQQTLRRCDKNFKSFFSANKDWKKNPKKYKSKPRPPHFKRGTHDNLIYDYQAFSVKGETVVLEKGLEIPLPKQLTGVVIKQIEIIPKLRSFYAVFVFEKTISFKQVPSSDKVMSIDLGLNNLATCVTNGVIKPFIIDGKWLKSTNAHYNKRKALMQSKLSHRSKKWSAKLQSLTGWRNAVVNDYMHRATHVVVKTCMDNGISKVVVGDVAKSLNGIKLGKRTNQNFVNLSLGQFVDKLSYKLGSHSIELVVTDESYTSKASFIDSDKMPKRYEPNTKNNKWIMSGRRVKRGLYKSSDGTSLNADTNGAYNILRKTDSGFTFSALAKKVGIRVREWLHPVKRVGFLQPNVSLPVQPIAKIHFERAN